MDEPKPLAVIEPRGYEPTEDWRIVQARQVRDGWITLILIALVFGVLTAHFLRMWVDVEIAQRPALETNCPTSSAQLNPYERELQERECHARARTAQ